MVTRTARCASTHGTNPNRWLLVLVQGTGYTVLGGHLQIRSFTVCHDLRQEKKRLFVFLHMCTCRYVVHREAKKCYFHRLRVKNTSVTMTLIVKWFLRIVSNRDSVVGINYRTLIILLLLVIYKTQKEKKYRGLPSRVYCHLYLKTGMSHRCMRVSAKLICPITLSGN